MSSSDWWNPSGSSNSPFTPQRPSSAPFSSSSFNNPNNNNGSVGPSRARFVGDELDPEDAKMAENIKFLPTFASSPAAKLALGQSPSSSSPPGAGGGSRRSPQARFSFGTPADSASPRNARTVRSPMVIDDDLPPTLSLRDPDLQSAQSPPPLPSSSSSGTLPTPPSLTSSPDTTTLHVFGPPVDQLIHLRSWLEEIGPINAYSPGPEGSNWYIVEYASPVAASYALRKHGDVVGGRWMIGFKVVQGSSAVVPRGVGTPIKVQNAPILRSKPAVVKKSTDEYAWEESEAPSGFVNKAAEWFFGR